MRRERSGTTMSIFSKKSNQSFADQSDKKILGSFFHRFKKPTTNENISETNSTSTTIGSLHQNIPITRPLKCIVNEMEHETDLLISSFSSSLSIDGKPNLMCLIGDIKEIKTVHVLQNINKLMKSSTLTSDLDEAIKIGLLRELKMILESSENNSKKYLALVLINFLSLNMKYPSELFRAEIIKLIVPLLLDDNKEIKTQVLCILKNTLREKLCQELMFKEGILFYFFELYNRNPVNITTLCRDFQVFFKKIQYLYADSSDHIGMFSFDITVKNEYQQKFQCSSDEEILLLGSQDRAHLIETMDIVLLLVDDNKNKIHWLYFLPIIKCFVKLIEIDLPQTVRLICQVFAALSKNIKKSLDCFIGIGLPMKLASKLKDNGDQIQVSILEIYYNVILFNTKHIDLIIQCVGLPYLLSTLKSQHVPLVKMALKLIGSLSLVPSPFVDSIVNGHYKLISDVLVDHMELDVKKLGIITLNIIINNTTQNEKLLELVAEDFYKELQPNDEDVHFMFLCSQTVTKLLDLGLFKVVDLENDNALGLFKLFRVNQLCFNLIDSYFLLTQ